MIKPILYHSSDPPDFMIYITCIRQNAFDVPIDKEWGSVT